MILPIYLYGQTVLRKEAEEVTSDYPELQSLVQNMFATMEHAQGVGLAAPQVGLPLRMFVVDGTPVAEDYPECAGFRRCVINPEILEQSEDKVSGDEGCLSVPGVYEAVTRPNWIVLKYLDENFEEHTEKLHGWAARMALHEYDHLDGKLFIDRVNLIRKQMIKGKLTQILKGKVRTDYRIKNTK